jgi:hypothetical protein
MQFKLEQMWRQSNQVKLQNHEENHNTFALLVESLGF